MKSIEHYEQLAREAKGEGCRHENADHMKPGDFWSEGPLDGQVALVEQLRCLDCGAWLSLGPSNDRVLAVEQEIRAVTLAVEFTTNREHSVGFVLGGEGWADAELGSWDLRERDEHEQWFDGTAVAGWLAHAILNHDAEQAETGGEG